MYKSMKLNKYLWPSAEFVSGPMMSEATISNGGLVNIGWCIWAICFRSTAHEAGFYPFAAIAESALPVVLIS